jgi:ariadne-1
MSQYSDTMDEDFTDNSDYHEEEEDFQFDPVVPDSKAKKVYEVNYKSLSPNDILNIQTEEINHVMNILGCSIDTAAILLRSFKWNKESLIESFMEDDRKVLKKSGVVMDDHIPQLEVIKDFCCDICCEDSPDLKAFSISCHHWFCQNCYRHYLTQKIEEEGESRHISCPGECKLIVDQHSISLLVSQKTYEKYLKLTKIQGITY